MVVKKECLLPLSVALIGICFSVYYESRSFILGYTAAMVFIWIVVQRPRITATFAWVMGTGFLGLICLLAFAVKTGSTGGRMLIYKVSANMFREHYLTGIGHDNFKSQYLHYQGAYFKQGGYTNQELLLADNTYYAFNDYWQFVIEWGIFGGLALLLFMTALFFAMVRVCRRSGRFSALYGTASVLVIAIAVAACFNHVFDRFCIQMSFFVGVCIIGWGIVKQFPKIRFLYFSVLLLCTGGLLYAEFGHKVFNAHAYRQWEEGKDLYRSGFIKDGLAYFEAAYPALKNNRPFMQEYANSLASVKRFEEAIEKYEEALHRRVHHSMYMSLGTCYQAVDRLEDAEQALLTAVNMVPNRFESRLALFDFYLKTSQKEEAVYWGRSILDLPVKVPSLRVDQIKQEVTERINVEFDAL